MSPGTFSFENNILKIGKGKKMSVNKLQILTLSLFFFFLDICNAHEEKHKGKEKEHPERLDRSEECTVQQTI